VLLAPDGPRIIDFGISAAMDATPVTGADLMAGSPGFMSPEQAEGLPAGPASDMFSLASVLTFAARGQGPFGTGEEAALLYRIVHGTPTLDQIPDKLLPLVSRCLSREARLRPTPSEFLAELTTAYPSAADLADWLPAGLLGMSAAGTEPVSYAGRAAGGQAPPSLTGGGQGFPLAGAVGVGGRRSRGGGCGRRGGRGPVAGPGPSGAGHGRTIESVFAQRHANRGKPAA
jgi:serine/threonine protein kinase